MKRQAAEISQSLEKNPFVDYTTNGYTSPGQESDSTRLSNFKQNPMLKAPVTNRDSMASTALSKITKVQPGVASTISPGVQTNP
jgi:hypothetical protein